MELKDLLQREKRLKELSSAAASLAPMPTCLLIFDKSLPFLSRALRVLLFESEPGYEVRELPADAGWASLQTPNILPNNQFGIWLPQFADLDFVDHVDSTWVDEKFQLMTNILRSFPQLQLILPWPDPRLDLGPVAVTDLGSPWNCVRLLNARLLEEKDLQSRIVPTENLVQSLGFHNIYDPRWDLSVQMPWSSAFQLKLADWIVEQLRFRLQGPKKILALRSSGLLWPMGEKRNEVDLSANDLESRAHLHFQVYLLQLKARGVRLVAIDELTEGDEKEMDEIPGMILQKRDFSFSAQGQTTVSAMIAQATEILGCSPEDVVYLDHDDEVIELLQAEMPKLSCVCMEVDPCLRVQQLQQKPYFWAEPRKTSSIPIEFVQHPWSDDEI